MKTKSKSKLIITLLLGLGVLISAFSGIFFFAHSRRNSDVYALDTKIEAPITVSKVKNTYLPSTQTDGSPVNFEIIQTSTNETIKNNELLILNTDEHVYISFNIGSLKYNTKKTTTEANETTTTDIVWNAPYSSTKYITLNVNVFLNGRPLLTNESITSENSDNRYYFQFLDLNTLQYKDESTVPPSEIEGHYKFVFTYSTQDGNNVQTGLTQTVEFYAFKAETYATSDINKIKVEPRVYNTEKIDREYFSTSTDNIDGIEYNYFNYNNINTTRYFNDSNSTASTLQFPQLSYDVTKYNIKFRHSLYGVYSDYQVMFKGFDTKNGYPTLSLIKDGVEYSANIRTKIGLQQNNPFVVSSNTLIYSYEVNGEKIINDIELVKQSAISNPNINRYVATLTFPNIGEYDYTYNYVVEKKEYNSITNNYTSTFFINSPNSTTKADSTFVKQENWSKIGDSKMYIFGYQLFHSDYSKTPTDNKEFKNGTLITDLSYSNQTVTTETNANSSFSKESLSGVVIDKICSTNQAPVTISYYASMTIGESDNKTESYYLYWKSINDYDNWTKASDETTKDRYKPTEVKNITNDTRFTQDGYYQVFIKYNFANYKKTDGDKLADNSQNTNHYQFFSFAINNSEPNIEVKTVETPSKTVVSNGYTNQNVKITWSANTVFDISPRVRILKHLFENNTDSWIEVYNNNQASVQNYGITYTNNGTESIEISNEYNGLYQVIINYGPGKNTVVKYRFNIDTANITGLTSYEILNLNENNTISFEENTNSIISSGFSLNWNEKPSGAEITATYDFIPLEENDENFNEKNITELNGFLTNSTDSTLNNKLSTIKTNLNNKTINLYNGYSLKTINPNLPYVKAEISETNVLKSLESLKTSAGFYLFSIKDEAGNIAYKTIFVDNSKPVIYKFIEEETSFTTMIGTENIASRDSIVVWGSNKAIKIENTVQNDLTTFLNTSGETDRYFNSTDFSTLLVKIDQAIIKDNSSVEGKRYTNNHTITNSYQDFYIKYTNEQQSALENANDETKQNLINQYWNYGEHRHDITILDASLNSKVQTDIEKKSDISNLYNKVNNNSQSVELEMNGDNSLMMFYLTDSDGEYKRVYDSEISNNSKLYFEWLQNNDTDYEVSKITYYYFPLTFEESSSNYPYSSTPQKTESIDLSLTNNSSIHNLKVMSGSINTEGGSQTIEGMYLIRREYKNPINSSENVSGDYSPRYYLIFIDRNKVISYTSSLQLIGEKIGFKIGSDKQENYQIEFSGSDFLVDSSQDNLKFTTSKLPIEYSTLISDLNKFDNSSIQRENKEETLQINNENTGYNIANTILNTFKLNAPKIAYKATENDKYRKIDNNSTDDDDKKILTFMKNGYYQVTLSDKTNSYTHYSNEKNNYKFTFKVEVESPRAHVAKYADNDGVLEVITYDEEEQNISTNKQDMLIVWSKPVNNTGYDAEIDTKNYKIEVTPEYGSQVTLTSKNGTITITSENVTINENTKSLIHDISTNELKTASKFDNPTWDYYIDLAEVLKILQTALQETFSNQSARISVTLQYVGEEEDYSALTTETPNRFFYTIKNVVFDFKKPEYNINRLLNSDTYLNNYYTNLGKTSLLDKFYDIDSEINFENYAFTVDGNFTLNHASIEENSIWTHYNMDSYKMFMRKYNKYDGETREDLQSLTPDDERCSDSTNTAKRLIFNENFRIDGTNVYTDISNYYWDNNEHKAYTLDEIINRVFDSAYDCFYEIIEVDYAGNYRIYTVYVKADSVSSNGDGYSNAKFELSEEKSTTPTLKTQTFTNISRYEVNDTDNSLNLIDAKKINFDQYPFVKMFSVNLNLKEIYNDNEKALRQYVTVKVQDISAGKTSVLTLSPQGDTDKFIADLNALYSAYDRTSGNIYYLTFITSLGEILKIEHRKPSETYPHYSITRGDAGFTISFTVSINDVRSSAYFTNFQAYRAQNGALDETNGKLETDSNGNTIIDNIEQYLQDNNLNSATFSYTFKMQGNSGSEFYLIFHDNFDRELTLREIVGVEDNDDKIVFNSPSNNLLTIQAYDSSDITKPVDLTYSNNSAYFKFQNVLYTPHLYKMSMEKIGDNYILKPITQTGDESAKGEIEIDSALYDKDINGIWTYPLTWAEGEENVIYKVEFVSTQGSIFYYVGYHNSISEIYLVKPADSSSGNLKILIKDQDVNVFDREVYLNISDEDTLFPVTITATRSYLDANEQLTTENLGEITNNQILSKLGNYTFTAQNVLGTKITFIVKIEEKISTNYWVTHYVNGLDNGALVPIKPDKTNPYEYGRNVNNPIKYYTIYEFEVKTDTANGYRKELLKTPEEIKYNLLTVAEIYSYKIYQRVVEGSETIENDVTYITVTKVIANNNFIRSYDNQLLINDIPRTGSAVTITQDEENHIKTAILSLQKTYNLVEGNDIMMTITFNDQFLRDINLSQATISDLTFEDSGIYKFTFKDVAGNIQLFGNSRYFQMALINDVIFTINGSPSVNNSVFNESVVLALQNLDKFTGNITVVSKLNGKQIVVKSRNNTYTYSNYGFYEITLSGQVKKASNEEQTFITTVFRFRIINPNEAMATFEYIGLNNYEITKIEKLNTKQDESGMDITDAIRQVLGVHNLNTVALSSLENGLGGAGYYRITVNAKYSKNKPEQSFSFDVWLNNDFEVLIKCSIAFGSSTTKSINLTLNKKQIYNKIGDCKIYFNDTEWLVINETTATQNVTDVFTISENGTFNVRVVTNSGNTLESFVITKKEPLNAVAIIVIIISVIAVGAVTFIFFKLRKNMKVK